MVAFVTEIVSNMSTLNIFGAIIVTAAHHMGYNQVQLLLAVSFAASFAFMLPMAGGPNGFLRLMFECHSNSVGQRLHMLRVARLAPVHGHFLCGSSTAISTRLKQWRVSHVAWY